MDRHSEWWRCCNLREYIFHDLILFLPSPESFFTHSPILSAVLSQVNGYLPVVLLLVIILILPHIFYGIALHYEDRKTESDVQTSIIGRYFYYQASRTQ